MRCPSVSKTFIKRIKRINNCCRFAVLALHTVSHIPASLWHICAQIKLTLIGISGKSRGYSTFIPCGFYGNGSFTGNKQTCIDTLLTFSVIRCLLNVYGKDSTVSSLCDSQWWSWKCWDFCWNFIDLLIWRDWEKVKVWERPFIAAITWEQHRTCS